MLDNFISPYNATVVQKLNDAGTIMLGKQIWMNLQWDHQTKQVFMVQ